MADVVGALSSALVANQMKRDLARRLRRRRGGKQRVSRAVQRAQRGRISAKISTLAHEGVPPKKRVAMALHMAEEGRLGPHGGYRRAS